MTYEEIYSNLDISPIDGGKWILNKNYYILDLVIPKGFEFNGADVPRILTWLYSRHHPDRMPGVVVHDWFFSKKKYDIGNEYLELILKILPVKKSTRINFVLATKFHVWLLKIKIKINNLKGRLIKC